MSRIKTLEEVVLNGNFGSKLQPLESIATSPNLKSLIVRGWRTGQPREGLLLGEILSKATQLLELDVSGTALSDKGLEAFSNGPSASTLQSLDLSDTQVTGGGLAHITKFINLRKLTLLRTRAAEKAVEKLRQQMPNLIFVWSKG